MIGGNINNYNTIENLGSGFRLFDYDLDMRSIDHRGLFFDNLSFHNFGYGGDPNSVSRLRIDKNQMVRLPRDVSARRKLFRLQPAGESAEPFQFPNGLRDHSAMYRGGDHNSPHALYMDATCRITISHCCRNRACNSASAIPAISAAGPGFTTIHEGAESLLSTNVRNTTNSYRFGVDYKGLPRTTLSFDELLAYTKVDNITTDNNFQYQLANGTPVDLGVDFQGTAPCAKPVTSTPPRRQPSPQHAMARFPTG